MVLSLLVPGIELIPIGSHCFSSLYFSLLLFFKQKRALLDSLPGNDKGSFFALFAHIRPLLKHLCGIPIFIIVFILHEMGGGVLLG